MKTEAESGTKRLRAEGCRGHQRLERAGGSPLEPPGECGSANTLVLGSGVQTVKEQIPVVSRPSVGPFARCGPRTITHAACCSRGRGFPWGAVDGPMSCLCSLFCQYDCDRGTPTWVQGLPPHHTCPSGSPTGLFDLVGWQQLPGGEWSRSGRQKTGLRTGGLSCGPHTPQLTHRGK